MSKESFNNKKLSNQSHSPKIPNSFLFQGEKQQHSNPFPQLSSFTPLKDKQIFIPNQNATKSQSNFLQPNHRFGQTMNQQNNPAPIILKNIFHKKNSNQEEKKQLIKSMSLKIEDLTSRVIKLQKISRQNNRTKRIRRKSIHIKKNYKCTNPECGKFYGSQTALKKHMRTKHSQDKIKQQNNTMRNQ